MSDRDYVLWSLLAAGAFAALLWALTRFAGKPVEPPFARQRARLEYKRTEQAELNHPVEAARIGDAIARLDAFAARHPGIGRTLVVLDHVNTAAMIFAVAFGGLGLWAGRVGSRPGQWSVFLFIIPIYITGRLIDSIPPYDGQAKGALVAAGILAAFAIPLAIAGWWQPR